jgi:hypothetical protein
MWVARCVSLLGLFGAFVLRFLLVREADIGCRYEKPAGLLLSMFVYLVYHIALKFEGYDFPISQSSFYSQPCL